MNAQKLKLIVFPVLWALMSANAVLSIRLGEYGFATSDLIISQATLALWIFLVVEYRRKAH